MLSRVANSLYWLARYLERAEDAARFLAVTHSYTQELRAVSHAAADQCWGVACEFLGVSATAEESSRAAFTRYLLDPDLPTSLYSSVALARENGRGIRDAISSEMWEALNVLYLWMLDESKAPTMEAAELGLLGRIQRTSHLFQGLRDHTMVRSDEWHFLRLGQFLERADSTARILNAMFDHPALAVAAATGEDIDTINLATTLRACTAFAAYSRASHTPSPGGVAEFLLLDGRFARSVSFCVQEMGVSLHALSSTPLDVFSNDAEQICGRLGAELRFAAIDEIMQQGMKDHLLRVRQKLWQLGEAIAGEYFR